MNKPHGLPYPAMSLNFGLNVLAINHGKGQEQRKTTCEVSHRADSSLLLSSLSQCNFTSTSMAESRIKLQHL